MRYVVEIYCTVVQICSKLADLWISMFQPRVDENSGKNIILGLFKLVHLFAIHF